MNRCRWLPSCWQLRRIRRDGRRLQCPSKIGASDDWQTSVTIRLEVHIVTTYGPQGLRKSAYFHSPSRGWQGDDLPGSLADAKGWQQSRGQRLRHRVCVRWVQQWEKVTINRPR